MELPLDEVKITHSDFEKELELLTKNTHLESVSYNTYSHVRRYVHDMRFIEAKAIGIRDPSLRDCDLESVVRNKERVVIDYESSVTGNGIAWVYEKMRDQKVDLANFLVKVNRPED
ncbi:hypothetical protein PENTCL1PPCAC_13191, partial [Pristionchus entomophagus]